MSGKDWEFDELDDGALKIVGEVQLRKYGTFLEEYASQLLDIEDALDESLGDAWDYAYDPIALNSTPYEQATVLDLVRTDNKVFNKVTIVFVTLMEEIDELVNEAKAKFYPGIVLYGEGGVGDISETEGGDAQLLVARMLPFLQRISVYVNRVQLVVKKVVQQLASVHSARPAAQCIDPTDVHFEKVFTALGRLLTVLVALDEMIAQNDALQEHWVLYKRMMKSVRSNTDVFKVDGNDLPAFETWILTLEGQLLDGMLFQNTIQQPFDDATVGVSANPVFREEFTIVLRLLLAYLTPRLGEPNEREHRQEFVGLCSLFVFYNHLFRVVDKRLVKSLWDVQLKVPAVHLFGNVLIVPNEWISRKMPQILTLIDKRSADFDGVRREHLKRMDANIAGVAQQLYLNVCTWMVRMESPEPKVANIGQRKAVICQIYIQGILFAYQVSNFVKTFLALHSDLQVPMKNSYVQALFRMTELLKAIEQTFHRRSMWVANHTMHIVQHFTFSAIQLIRECAQNVKERVSAKSLDVLTAMDFMQTALNGPGTRLRRTAIDLALHVASSARAISPENLERLQNYLRKLEAINTLTDSIAQACNTDFLYWYRDFYPLYLNHLYQNPIQAHRIHYFFACLKDCVPVLKEIHHEESNMALVDAFKQEMEENLDECIVRPLCTDIETDLRLQIHTGVVRLDDRNPFRVEHKDLTQFLKVNPIRFLGENFDIRTRVTHYLDVTFYNLTTVALHDWKVYGQMRNLATQKYGLDMQDVYLPSQTLEQGLDVLMIMRNIHIFVADYLYNLNNQIFVQRASNNKFLQTINIRHVGNSIRTHGTGIMNTTVNFTYQFLRKKFGIFSQFLFDDHIKSRLIKDVRFFKEVRLKTDQMFPFERAEKFVKDIRKLGVNAKNESYLDQFRRLITEIGNAMGYIRMIRSGGLHCCSNAIRFVPDIDEIVAFDPLIEEEGLSAETQQAAKNVDAALGNLTETFAEESDYFKILVDVFAKEFRTEKNSHLRNFHAMVPPLCLNYVEYMISAKDKLNRKNKVGAAFTDDGFAMGLAYILKLLDQYHTFDSLHWFKSCKMHYAEERQKIQAKQVQGRQDEKLLQTVSLSLKRMHLYEKEIDLLFYSLSSARIFFRADQTAEEEAAEKGGGGGGAAAAGAAASGGDGGGAPPPAAAAAASGAPPPPPGPPPPP